MRRLLLVLGAAAYFVTALAWLWAERKAQSAQFAPGSVFDAGPDGLLLARRYLERRGRHVTVLSRSLDSAEVPADGVVLRIEPGLRLLPKRRGELLAPREDAWVRGGGRLVLGISQEYGPLDVRATQGPPEKVLPLWPGVGRLAGQPMRGFDALPLQAQAIFVSEDWPVLARLPFGRGEVLALALPELLSNAHLAEADHLRLLEALCGEGRPVLFDEHAHGLGRETGLVDLLGRYGLGPLLGLLALTGAAIAWRESVRAGPAQDDYRETRSEAVDLVDSVAQLYDRALRRDEALVLYHRSLAHAVAAKEGLRGRALEARLHALIGGPAPRRGGRSDVPAALFLRTLKTVNDGFGRIRHGHTR